MRIKLVLIFLSFASPLYSQNVLNTIIEPSIKTFTGRALGDSVVMMAKSNIYGALLILPDEKSDFLNLQELEKELVCGIVNTKATIDFYFLEIKKKGIGLKVLKYDRIKQSKIVLEIIPEIKGAIVGTVLENKNIFILTVLPDQSFNVINIRDNEIKKETVFKLDFRFSDFQDQSTAAIIEDGLLIKPLQAERPLKIYFSYPSITITAEMNEKTLISKLNLDNGQFETTEISCSWGEDYGTFIHQDLLFSVSQVDKDYFIIRVHELASKKEILQFEINKDAPFKNELSFLRDERTKVVLHNKSVWDAMSNGGSPFICVYTKDDGSIMLKLGTHRSIISGPMVPLPGIIGGIVSAAINESIGTEKSVALYFFLKGNLTNGFQYDGSLDLMEQRIDTYETYDRKKKQKTKYLLKNYIYVPGKTYSFYRTNKEQHYLKVLAF